MEAITQNDQREGVIETFLRRTKDGVRVNIKADPEVEDYIRNLSSGIVEGVRVFGRDWIQPPQPPTASVPMLNSDGSVTQGPPIQAEHLRVYTFPWGENQDELIHPCSFNLSFAGRPLRLPNGRANLNFLRLVGISRPEGVTFIWNALLSLTELERLHDQVSRGQDRFYNEYLRPADMKISLVLTKV